MTQKWKPELASISHFFAFWDGVHSAWNILLHYPVHLPYHLSPPETGRVLLLSLYSIIMCIVCLIREIFMEAFLKIEQKWHKLKGMENERKKIKTKYRKLQEYRARPCLLLYTYLKLLTGARGTILALNSLFCTSSWYKKRETDPVSVSNHKAKPHHFSGKVELLLILKSGGQLPLGFS